MVQTAPQLTDYGVSLLLSAIAGEEITFTRFKAGNGSEPGDDDLGNACVEYPFSTYTIGDGYITLEGSFDSASVESAFQWRELGVFCEDKFGNEHMYAYANDGESASWIKPNSDDVVGECKTGVVVAIGSAEHVTAIISDSQLYAPKDAFDAHVANVNNPHGVTKAQIGLGNVPNVTTNNQTPTYTEASAPAALSPGEKISAAFAKIAAAVSTLISHIANNSNPHGVTRAQIGAAATSHTHSATDVITGTLPIARGGTGAASENEVRGLFRENKSYIGDGTYGSGHARSVTFTGGAPLIVIVCKVNNVGGVCDTQVFMRNQRKASSAAQSGHSIDISWGSKTISWYSDTATAMFNESSLQYTVVAFY